VFGGGSYVPNAFLLQQIAVGTDLYQIVDGTLWRISGSTASVVASVGGEAGDLVTTFSYHMTVAGNTLYFITGHPDGGGYDVWKCVGSTVPEKILDSPNITDPVDTAVIGSDVYFTDAGNIGSSTHVSHLWKFDGSPSGPEIVKTWTRSDPGVDI